MLYFIVMNHPLTDGNKRLGHLVLWEFLRINGYGVSPSVVRDLTLGIASMRLSVNDVLTGRASYAVISLPRLHGGYVIVRVARAFAGACKEKRVNALLPIEGTCSYYTSAKNVRDALEFLREFINWEKALVFT